MKLSERSYGGKFFRPRPLFHISEDQKLMILVTPWGNADIAPAFIQLITSYMNSYAEEPEKMKSLSMESLNELENRLRTAILAAHEDLRDQFNGENLSAGAEILCLVRGEKKITWFQVGAPFMSLLRAQHLLPLHHPVDLSFDLSQDNPLPPLPKDLLGVSQQLPLAFGSFLFHKEDHLILIARSYVPELFFQLGSQSLLDIEEITKALSQDNTDHPFWVGVLSLAS